MNAVFDVLIPIGALLLAFMMLWVCFPWGNLPFTMATDPREKQLREIMKQREMEEINASTIIKNDK